jgi:hypothetical protein
VGRLKTVRKNGNTAHFEAMFGAKICSLSTIVRQSCFSDPFSLQSKPLQPDYVSSHKKDINTEELESGALRVYMDVSA